MIDAQKRRATVKWLLFFALMIGGTGAFLVITTRADSPQLTVQICRSNVEPCQTEVNIAKGGRVALDLFLDGGPPSEIVAWQTRHRLTNSPVADLIPDPTSGEPVQEQGDRSLALDGLNQLQDSPSQADSQYFTAQNQHGPGSGQVDYSVTLIRFDQTKAQPRVQPIASQSRPLIGRITVKGRS